MLMILCSVIYLSFLFYLFILIVISYYIHYTNNVFNDTIDQC